MSEDVTMVGTLGSGTVLLLPGVYRKVTIGFTLDPAPLWSVDIATNIEGQTVFGNGPTLEAAAADAMSKVAAFDGADL